MSDLAGFDLRHVAWPWALPLVIVAPLLTAWMIARARRIRARRLEHLGNPQMIARLAPAAVLQSRWHLIRMTLVVALLAAAFAGPRWGIERTVVRQPGIDVVLALDASSSMLARDESPDRLTSMKRVVDRLRELSPNDRFALIAFAGRSYVLSPATIDHAGLSLFIDNLDPTIVGQSGSSLSSALRQANNLLALSESEAERAIVLMSDGEGFEDAEEVVAEARRSAAAGTSVITVGFGTPEGSTIPERRNGVMTEKKDQSGQTVVTRFSPEQLQAAATAGRGVFVPPTEADRAAAVRRSLATLRTERRALTRGTNLAHRFQLFVIPALLLLVLDTFLATRRGRRRGVSAVATAASSLAAVIFLDGCSVGSARDKDAIGLYNRGTAMIARPDSAAEGVSLLKRAEVTQDEEVRYRAGFNAGYAHLREGLAARGDSAELPLDSALAVYRRVLTLRPDDLDAKWNYELALRRRSGGGGGGGGGQNDPAPQPEPQNAEEQAPRPRPIPGMNEQRAEALLNAVEQQEQDVQGRKQRRSVPQPPPGGRDW